MTTNYMEFMEIVKKYEFDKMFKDDATMQKYCDIMLHIIFTTIQNIDELDSIYTVIDRMRDMLSIIHHDIPSDVVKAIAYEIKFRIGNKMYYDGNCMTLFAAIINIILA